MKKEPLVFIGHIEECIGAIESYMRGKTKSEFLADRMLQDAVVRRLEVMGEAVKNLPTSFTAKYPEVPWNDIARTRDKLIHDYFGVDLQMTLEIISDDLPKLKRHIAKIIKKEGGI